LQIITARVNGIDLHVRTAGAGPLIVLVHGFPQTVTSAGRC
jgi:pimeloyl-ACP methyl ester carboxylesterase